MWSHLFQDGECSFSMSLVRFVLLVHYSVQLLLVHYGVYLLGSKSRVICDPLYWNTIVCTLVRHIHCVLPHILCLAMLPLFGHVDHVYCVQPYALCLATCTIPVSQSSHIQFDCVPIGPMFELCCLCMICFHLSM